MHIRMIALAFIVFVFSTSNAQPVFVKHKIDAIVELMRLKTARPTGRVHMVFYTPDGRPVHVLHDTLSGTNAQPIFTITFDEFLVRLGTYSDDDLETVSITLTMTASPSAMLDLGADGVLDFVIQGESDSLLPLDMKVEQEKFQDLIDGILEELEKTTQKS